MVVISSAPNPGERCSSNVIKEKTRAKTRKLILEKTRRDPSHLSASQASARHQNLQLRMPNTTWSVVTQKQQVNTDRGGARKVGKYFTKKERKKGGVKY